MSDVNITISPDLSKLAKKYSDKPKEFNEAIGRALKKSALMVEGEAKKVTPVDTGRLRASIFTTIYENYATVMPKTNYALYVHEGTRYMKGRPFMLWGADEVKPKINKIFSDEIQKAIK